ncbi:MAG: hypothetical protein SH819_14260 [Cytophagales bacterium]|nr:hypothetical protein [Cytophagales bacterium]
MKNLIFIAFFGFLSMGLFAQKDSVTPLFQDQQPLSLKITTSLKDIKKKTNDSTYLPAHLYLKNASGGWDSIKIDIRARGIFRRKNCYFAPIRIKVSKEHAKGTILEGNKNLKLVMPCQNNNSKNELVVKEFICYKMFEKLSPYYFSTRMVNLDFTEDDGKKPKNHQLTAFLIEDDDLVAKRHHAKVMENMNLHPLRLNDTTAIKHDLFQYMIGNTDWSTTFLHNSKVMFQEPNKYIPLAYDFDMTGFVDPPYGQANAQLGLTSLRERLYRGFCRANEGPIQAVRKQFLAAEPEVIQVMAKFEKDFQPRDYGNMKKYVEEFFAILKSDSDFKEKIIDGCRKK